MKNGGGMPKLFRWWRADKQCGFGVYLKLPTQCPEPIWFCKWFIHSICFLFPQSYIPSLQSKLVMYPPQKNCRLIQSTHEKDHQRYVFYSIIKFHSNPITRSLQFTHSSIFRVPPSSIPPRLVNRVNFYLQVSLVGSLICRSLHSNSFSRFPVSPKTRQNNTPWKAK